MAWKPSIPPRPPRKLREFAFATRISGAAASSSRSAPAQSDGCQRELVYARVARRRAPHLKAAAIPHVPSGQQRASSFMLCNANHHQPPRPVFLEPHHFEYLRTQVLVPLVARPRTSGGLRSGRSLLHREEPYTPLPDGLEAVPDIHRWTCRISPPILKRFECAGARARRYYIPALKQMAECAAGAVFQAT